MKDKIAWILLAEKARTCRKTQELAKNFEKRKKEADLTSERAYGIMADIEQAAKCGADIITYIDDAYPDVLRHIAYPPPYLYVKGRKELLNYPVKVTIAGSREATGYGMNTAANFAHELANNGVCIVSGGAKGIDTAALRGAMRAGNDVIVVLGSGIDVYYPSENRELFEKIALKGLIISEFAPGTGPYGSNFPIRNRIMTALGDSVVIVEAAARSGSLISASHAAEQGKTLFAVPGNIDAPNSKGTNELIRDGAQMALSGSDILYELMERIPDKIRQAHSFDEKEEENAEEKSEKINTTEKNLCLTPMELAVVNAIKSGKNTYDEIFEFCSMEAGKLTSLLTIMEMKGIIELVFGNRYKLNE